VIAGVLFAVGYLQAASCGALSLAYFGIGICLVGGAVGVFSIFRTAGFILALGAVLTVAGFLIGNGGATGCGI
jgi:hypothetical protein